VSNSFEENDCENANTHAQGGEHLLVLAHFRHFYGDETLIFFCVKGWNQR
jgi:hypothetical protein